MDKVTKLDLKDITNVGVGSFNLLLVLSILSPIFVHIYFQIGNYPSIVYLPSLETILLTYLVAVVMIIIRVIRDRYVIKLLTLSVDDNLGSFKVAKEWIAKKLNTLSTSSRDGKITFVLNEILHEYDSMISRLEVDAND